jgi:hypothetical protein
VSWINRGGFDDPLPTERMPPNPPSRRSFSSRTVTSIGKSSAAANAASAKFSGAKCDAGVLTKSRARRTALPTVSPMAAACFHSAAFESGTRTVNVRVSRRRSRVPTPRKVSNV